MKEKSQDYLTGKFLECDSTQRMLGVIECCPVCCWSLTRFAAPGRYGVREIAFGEAANFVGSGLDLGGEGQGRRGVDCILGGLSGLIDDGVGAGRKRFDGFNEMRYVECGGNAAGWWGLVTQSGVVAAAARWHYYLRR